MAFDLTEIISATMILFAVIDIIGSIPIILDIKKRAGEVHPEKATLVAMIIMFAFLFWESVSLHLSGLMLTLLL